MKHLVNIKGYRRASFINGVTTYKWWVFYVTRKPYAAGITGMETAKLEVFEDVYSKCGPPVLGKVYEVEYGPHDTLDSYVLYQEGESGL